MAIRFSPLVWIQKARYPIIFGAGLFMDISFQFKMIIALPSIVVNHLIYCLLPISVFHDISYFSST